MTARQFAALAACLLVIPLGLSASPAAAGTLQTANGHTVAFAVKQGGNEWWVEAVLSGSGASTVTKVEAMDTGGPWTAMIKRPEWGSWSASFRIEPGNQVRFRAAWSDATVITSCWFTFPQGVEQCTSPSPPPPPPPTSGFSATFSSVKGNTWWEEAKVAVAGGTLAGVDVHIGSSAGFGTWKPLTLRSWGSWAGSHNAPENSIVQFRARSTAGAEALSSCYRWTAATAIACPTVAANVWPREGSFAKYEVSSGMGVPGYGERHELNVTMTYTNGRWESRCQGFDEHEVGYEGDPYYEHEVTPFDFRASPPLPTVWKHDGLVHPYGLEGCMRTDTMDFASGQVAAGWFLTRKNGVAVNVTTLQAEHDDGCCTYTHAQWHAGTNLVLEFGQARLHSGIHGWLVDTDAPIARTDAAPASPPKPAWPVVGSYVKFSVRSTYDSEYSASVTYWNNTYRYDGATWSLTCEEHYIPVRGGGEEQTGTYTTRNAVLPTGPLSRIGPGGMVLVPVGGCGGGWSELTKVVGTQSRTVVRNGQNVSTQAWWSDESPDQVGDDDFWWHTGSGLLLGWELDGDDDPSYEFSVGKLVGTDAPL